MGKQEMRGLIIIAGLMLVSCATEAKQMTQQEACQFLAKEGITPDPMGERFPEAQAICGGMKAGNCTPTEIRLGQCRPMLWDQPPKGQPYGWYRLLPPCTRHNPC